ncbi:MAG: hypothetical protein IKI84_09430 [Clostridia bacterium]|nr:hypothetical protein [Clostridia bacterium]
MKDTVINIGDYIHPEERAASERIMAMTQAAGWSESALGEGLDETNRYILSSSCYLLPPEHPLARLAAEESERFGLEEPPRLYIARRFSYDLQLGGYRVPTVIVPSVLTEENDLSVIRCRIIAAVAGVRAGHHRLEHMVWLAENMSGTIPLPFVSQAALALLYEWKRAMRYSQDRAVYLATGDLKEALRNILYGTVPREMLDRFDFGPEGTFVPQVERYGRGIVQKTMGAFAGMMQDHAHLPERYARLTRFAQGGARE